MTFRRSSTCEASACAEVAVEPDVVLVRSSRDPDVVATFTAEQWRAFTVRVRDGEFDVNDG